MGIKHLVKRPIGVLGMLFMLVVPGWWMAYSLPVQLMPKADIPVLVVDIPIVGLPAMEIEQHMMPAFRQAAAGLEQLTQVRTFSLDGKATLHCEFEWDCSMHHQFDLLSEAMIISSRLFPEAGVPLISLPGKTALPIATIMVSSEDLTLSELTTWATAKGIKYFEQVPAIAYCDMIGGSKQVPVFMPNFPILNQHNLSLTDISQALQDHSAGHFSILSTSAGRGIRLTIEQPQVRLDSLARLGIRIHDKFFQLGQLGQLTLVEDLGKKAASVNGRQSIAFLAYQRPGSDLIKLPEQLQGVIHSLSVHYPHIQVDIVDDQASWISLSMDGLTSSLLTASCLAICLLFLVIKSWQAPLLMGITIPISLGLTSLAFTVFDLGINMMTLAGLTLGTGVLIDNGIVMVEQLESFRRKGTGAKQAAIQASRKMTGPLLSSTMTTVSVFIPIWLVEGRAATLFQDLGLAVTISLVASLLIAIWLLPVLSSLMPLQTLRPRPQIKGNSGIHYLRVSGVLAGIGIIGLLAGSFLLPVELFPQVSQNSILIHLTWNQEVSIEQNDQLCRRVQTEVFDTLTCFGLSGNLSTAEGPMMLRESIISVSIPESQREPFFRSLQDWLDREAPECQVSWREPNHALVEWIGKREQPIYAMTPPSGDIHRMSDFVPNLQASLQDQPSLQSLHVSHFLRPQTLMSPNQAALLRHGIPASDLAREVQLFSGGTAFLQLHAEEGRNLFMAQHSSVTSGMFRDFSLKNVPIEKLLQVETVVMPEMIRGDLKGPFLTVTQQEGASWDDGWLADLQSLISREGWAIQEDQQATEQRKSTQQLALMFGIGVLLLFVTLLAQFNSFRFPLIILSTIPFGLAGSFLLLQLTDQSLNMISGIGLIIVSGIVVNDAILKASAIRSLLLDGAPIHQAIRLASHQRKRAILLTSATTILAMVPILFSSGAGAELQLPMAISVIGGIVLGTAAAMWWIPAVVLRFPPTK